MEFLCYLIWVTSENPSHTRVHRTRCVPRNSCLAEVAAGRNTSQGHNMRACFFRHVKKLIFLCAAGRNMTSFRIVFCPRRRDVFYSAKYRALRLSQKRNFTNSGKLRHRAIRDDIASVCQWTEERNGFLSRHLSVTARYDALRCHSLAYYFPSLQSSFHEWSTSGEISENCGDEIDDIENYTRIQFSISSMNTESNVYVHSLCLMI
jgi:hypothetical protein